MCNKHDILLLKIKYIMYYRRAASGNYELQLERYKRMTELDKQMKDDKKIGTAEMQCVYR